MDNRRKIIQISLIYKVFLMFNNGVSKTKSTSNHNKHFENKVAAFFYKQKKIVTPSTSKDLGQNVFYRRNKCIL